MDHQFTRHYTLAEARALLPELRRWLTELQEVTRTLDRLDSRLSDRLEALGDQGGERVGNWIRTVMRQRELAEEFASREIQLKDLDRGLVDFPSLRGHREVFLCWELAETDIEHWHDLDTGFGGREPL